MGGNALNIVVVYPVFSFLSIAAELKMNSFTRTKHRSILREDLSLQFEAREAASVSLLAVSSSHFAYIRCSSSTQLEKEHYSTMMD